MTQKLNKTAALYREYPHPAAGSLTPDAKRDLEQRWAYALWLTTPPGHRSKMPPLLEPSRRPVAENPPSHPTYHPKEDTR